MLVRYLFGGDAMTTSHFRSSHFLTLNHRIVIIAILLDTKGPEIRTGFFANGAKKISLAKDQSLVLTSDYSFKGDSCKIACSYEKLATSVSAGQTILVADGSLVLTVLSTDPAAGEVTCRVENNASIGERKNMNLPGVVVDLPVLTEKDIKDITDWGVPNKIDFIAASFVQTASDIHLIREILGPENQGIKVIAKIENQEGLDNYDAILEATDGIMVARGDLGMVGTIVLMLYIFTAQICDLGF